MDFLYYLCCYGCCGLFNRRKGVIVERTAQKRKNLDLLEKIAAEQKLMPITSDPTEKKITELTDIYSVPSHAFPTEDSLINSYGFKIYSMIASGSFAEVYKAVHIEKKVEIACKKIVVPDLKGRHTVRTEKKTSRLKDIKNELFILQEMRHPFVVRLLRHFAIDNGMNVTLHVFMQFAPKGTLKEYLDRNGPFEESVCKHWFAQLLSAMYFMHRKGIAHRDLKLSNILLDTSNDILISDFGLSRIAYRKSQGGLIESDTYCGTPLFMAPELFEHKPYNPFLVDVWAMGVILYCLYCKDYPFKTNEDKGIALQNMKAKKWSYTLKIVVISLPSKQLTDILNKLFEPDPNLRPSVDKIRKHSWIKNEYKKVDKRAQKLISKSYQTINTTKSMKTTKKVI